MCKIYKQTVGAHGIELSVVGDSKGHFEAKKIGQNLVYIYIYIYSFCIFHSNDDIQQYFFSLFSTNIFNGS